jgi:hypothetical protein
LIASVSISTLDQMLTDYDPLFPDMSLTLYSPLCRALHEISDESASNPLLNGSLFRPSYLAKEVIPEGGNNMIGHFSDDIDGLEYDIQYIQVGWSMAKSYGPVAPGMGLLGWSATLKILGNDEYFDDRNWEANLRGLRVGSKAAITFDNFSDFVNAACPLK